MLMIETFKGSYLSTGSPREAPPAISCSTEGGLGATLDSEGTGEGSWTRNADGGARLWSQCCLFNG